MESLTQLVLRPRTRIPAGLCGGLMLLACILALSCPAKASLVVNGSFEDPDIPQNSFALFSSITGWTRFFGPSIEIQDRIAGNDLQPAFDGFQQLELDSTANTGIQQTITIPADGLYNLSLAYSPRPGLAASSAIVQVLWDGTIIGTFGQSGVGLTQLTWSVENLQIDALAGDHVLGLQAAGTSDSLGGLVDAVSLNAVPEPGTWLLGVAGLSAVALKLRRRKATMGPPDAPNLRS